MQAFRMAIDEVPGTGAAAEAGKVDVPPGQATS